MHRKILIKSNIHFLQMIKCVDWRDKNDFCSFSLTAKLLKVFPTTVLISSNLNSALNSVSLNATLEVAMIFYIVLYKISAVFEYGFFSLSLGFTKYSPSVDKENLYMHTYTQTLVYYSAFKNESVFHLWQHG